MHERSLFENIPLKCFFYFINPFNIYTYVFLSVVFLVMFGLFCLLMQLFPPRLQTVNALGLSASEHTVFKLKRLVCHPKTLNYYTILQFNTFQQSCMWKALLKKIIELKEIQMYQKSCQDFEKEKLMSEQNIFIREEEYIKGKPSLQKYSNCLYR